MLMHFMTANEPTMEAFIEQVMEDKEVAEQLEPATCCNDVAKFAAQLGYTFDGVLLLKYMASQVLTLNEEQLMMLVKGSDFKY